MADLPARLQTVLADRYVIERELGAGGMATVYLARDLRHDREVALKVLRPELAQVLGPDRFLREITTTAQLTHPHVLPLHDSGEAAGFLYYVMPYVEGESLRDRLSREKQLPLEDALRIAREVADGLSYAHSHGVVHRDIKPENILLQSGHAVVADFGIAKAIAAAGSARLTETGLAVGTPQYMSPEQAAGEADLDGRSDLYSLGCVLYEMLAGHPPFTGSTAQEVRARHSLDAVPLLTAARPAVPPHVERAVNTALAKVPADRFATAAQFARALEGAVPVRTSAAAALLSVRHRTLVRIGAAVGGALVVAAAAWFATVRSAVHRGGAVDSLRSVAVLPFTSLGDSTQEYLADGFTVATIDALVRVEGLRVPASGRVFWYRGRDVREVGRELEVGMVVTGSAQVAGGRLRVWAQLVKVDDGTSVWSHQYNSDMAGIFPTQDSIATGIVEALRPRLAEHAGAGVRRGVRTQDLEAYQLYVEARRATYELTLAGNERAITLLEQALARDSTFADAWVALADAYGFYSQFGGLPPAEVSGRWRRAAERGIQLDSLNGYAFAQRGMLRAQYDWDWDAAWGDLRRAARLSPASADAALLYAQFLSLVGEQDSALAQNRHAVALDPTNDFYVANLAVRFDLAGMPDSAKATAERALGLNPGQWAATFVLARLFAAAGRRAEAERETDRMLNQAADGVPLALSWAASLYGMAGRPDRARDVLHRLDGLGRRQYVQATYVAQARLAAGDRSGALDALEEAARNHDSDLAWGLILFLAPLDREPRYEQVRRTVFGNRPAPRGWPRAQSRSPLGTDPTSALVLAP